MTTIVKGNIEAGNASGSFGLLPPPANGSYFVGDSTQALGYNTKVAPPVITQGTATLVSGTVIVANSAVTASSNIFLTAASNGAFGSLQVTSQTAGTGFTISSSLASDSGAVSYLIVG